MKTNYLMTTNYSHLPIDLSYYQSIVKNQLIAIERSYIASIIKFGIVTLYFVPNSQKPGRRKNINLNYVVSFSFSSSNLSKYSIAKSNTGGCQFDSSIYLSNESLIISVACTNLFLHSINLLSIKENVSN